MKYKCLVFDHDDTVVNSTATIHYQSFVKYLEKYFPGRSCTLEEYFLKNFDPGFIPMCRDEFGMTEADLDIEVAFWREYVKDHVPEVYPGIREIMERHKAEGGLLCVVSHSLSENIRRDYEVNGLPAPDAVYGWELPMEQRKPAPYALCDIMERFSLAPSELLVIDDLKPGYDMALSVGVDFVASGWANDIAPIESFMRENCRVYCKTVAELAAYLG